jgi:hypothetical protein
VGLGTTHYFAALRHAFWPTLETLKARGEDAASNDAALLPTASPAKSTPALITRRFGIFFRWG